MRRGNRRERAQATKESGGNPLNQPDKNSILTQKKMVQLSKKLSYVLRHGATKEGFNIDNAGFILISEIMASPKFKNYSFEQIQYVVENNDKKRFELVLVDSGDESKGYKIRAVQGHSINTIDEEAIYELIEDPEQYPTVVHGTDLKAWTNFIRFSGLKKMGRTHIHFAKGLPGDKEVISGMRFLCDVVIQINLKLAMKDGFKFFKSKNDVILCAGKGPEGQLPPKYFSQVLFRDKKKSLVPVPTKSFEYLLVLDFEANCVNQGKLECQEIIEFPVVPINTIDKTPVCDPFHFYIKPTVVPEISEFCTELTGITQDKVNAGITIDKCLIALDEWMKSNGFNAQNSTFVTCGSWDFNTCLRMEATYKKLNLMSYLKKFINIKDIWMHTMFKNKGTGMPGMLSSLNLELEGKHHSGIDDSKNIAKIAIALLEKGGIFSQFQERIVKDKSLKKLKKKQEAKARNNATRNKNIIKRPKNNNPLNG